MDSISSLISRIKGHSDIALAVAGLALLGIMVMPLPGWVLDMLLATSFAVALLVFLTTLSVKKALDLSVFPSLLLVTTLFRLSLNVASTRLILLSSGEGTASAGRIIEAFGRVVVGGNYAVGIVVFAILVIINFMVINKGAGRVAEVSARFTLDAMPGKQMAIDAELNAGMIDEKQAKARRAEVAREANFFGSMDGASKFIKGDAIAGIVITLVNVLGGMFIGVIQHGMPLSQAVETYTLLTIGDGLVGQIPALIVSAAAGLLVTRVPDLKDSRLDDQFGAQLFASPRTIGLLAGALGGFALIPGLRLPFALLGGVVGVVAWQMRKRGGEEPEDAEEEEEKTRAARPLGPEDMLNVEPLSVEIGLDLLYLVDEAKGGTLVEAIQRLRNQFAQDLGIVVPSVHLCDDAKLSGGTYVIRLRGEEIGRGKVYPRQHLAMAPGQVSGKLRGIETTDPVYGMPAYWIQGKHVLGARAKGYTVVDVPAVLSTHISELIHLHAHELFSANQLGRVLERVGEDSPKLVEDLIPGVLSRAQVLRVMRNLLKEGISVRDVTSILEALAESAERTKDAELLTEFVRQRLARQITRRIADEEGVVHVIGLAPDAQKALSEAFSGEGGRPRLDLDPVKTSRLVQSVKTATEGWTGASELAVLAPPLMRGPMRQILSLYLPRVRVVSPMEILPMTPLKTEDHIRFKRAAADA
ncbi:MAG: flagellar biosynthesis protein FlhA [Myxococcota bacterium]|nr:flagellar biosynthesis protein FlhA [Myxococcota bacterium]